MNDECWRIVASAIGTLLALPLKLWFSRRRDWERFTNGLYGG